MEGSVNRNPIIILAIGHVICCGGLVLFATGAGAGIVAFLAEGGIGWLAGGVALAGAGVLLWARMRRHGYGQGAGREPGEIERRLGRMEPESKQEPVRTSCRSD